MTNTATPSARVSSIADFGLAELLQRVREPGVIDLALGIPEVLIDSQLRQAACEAIRGNENQYAEPAGLERLRRAISDVCLNGMYSPHDEITVTVGATEGLMAALLSLIDAGDEVALFEPYYENHVRAVKLAGASCRITRLQSPDWAVTDEVLAEAIGPRTRVLLLSTPSNPAGSVLQRSELERIADVCSRSNVVVICDETYRAFVFDGCNHMSPAQILALRERTIVLRSFSKSHLVSGWRVGFAAAPAALTSGLRRAHDSITCGAAAPLQSALATTLCQLESAAHRLGVFYNQQRDRCIRLLDSVGFHCFVPRGGIFFLARTPSLTDSREFARMMLDDLGVAMVPGGAFFRTASDGCTLVRCCFAKNDATLAEAERRLMKQLTPATFIGAPCHTGDSGSQQQ